VIFVCLTETDGKDVWINLDHIVSIKFDEFSQTTFLYEARSPDSSHWRVRGRPEDIEKKVAHALYVRKGFRA
jgi:hypothetical protein